MTTTDADEMYEHFQFMQYSWDVSAAAERAAGLPVGTLEVDSCRSVLPWVCVDQEHAATVDLEVPLLAVRVKDMDDLLIVIDGWHRLTRAVKEGRAELPCRVLGEEDEFAVRLTGGRKGLPRREGRRRRG